MKSSRARLLMAALAMTASLPGQGLPALNIRRLDGGDPPWPMKPAPDNRGRRAEKAAIALAKEGAKRQRRTAKQRSTKR